MNTKQKWVKIRGIFLECSKLYLMVKAKILTLSDVILMYTEKMLKTTILWKVRGPGFYSLRKVKWHLPIDMLGIDNGTPRGTTKRATQ